MSKKPKILYLIHSYYKGAGTEHHVRDLAEGFKNIYEVTVVVPNEGKVYALRDDAALMVYDCAEAPFPLTPNELPDLRGILDLILKKVEPDLIHIHHIVRWPLSVIDQLLAFQKPTLMTFHDYYAVTPHFPMQGVEDPRDTLTTGYSIKVFGSDVSKYLKDRREIFSRAISKLTKRIVPSKFLAVELAKVFPGEYTVIEHGINPFEVLPKTKSKSLRFGYVGNLLPQKGWEYLVRAFAKVRHKYPSIELHLFGGVQKFSPKESDGIFSHGYYEKHEIPKILSQVDVGIIPSVFKEPYCFVLSEMWHAGLPVAVSDIGALSERVTDGVSGKKFKAGDVEEIVKTLEWFLEKKEWKEWTIPKPKLAQEMLTDYQNLYRGLLS